MRGFSTQLASLDDYAERLPAKGAVAIVSASYNGSAPDNAVEFQRWLDGADDALNGVRLQRVRLRQHRLGLDLPGGATPHRRAA